MSAHVSPVHRVFAAVAAAGLFLTSGPVSAADFYWDPDGTAAGNGTDGTGTGGTGTWDTSSLFWWDGTSNVAWPNGTADNAVFSYGYFPGPPTENTVTASSGIQANKISFIRSGYSLTGGDITLAGTDAGLHVNRGESAIVSSQILGSGGLTVTGGGSIRLTNNTNSYTGLTTIANGTLIITAPSQLGADASAISILTTNQTPLNNSLYGFGGGSLMLDGTAFGFTFSRDINLEGRGPVGERGAAVLSIGNNTLSGTVTSAVSPLPLSPTASFRNGRISSVNGTLTLSGTLNVAGTALAAGSNAGTTGTVTSLGGVNTTGVGNYDLTGILAGVGIMEKSGAGTLFLNPSSTSGFSGQLRVSSSATGQQSSVRVTQLTVGGTSVFGAGNLGEDAAAIDMNGGVIEFRSESSLNYNSLSSGKNIFQRADSTMFAGPGVGGQGVNGTVTLGAYRVIDGADPTFNSRNGYGFTFQTWTQEQSDGDNTVTNNLGGTLTFTGNVWNNSDPSNRLLTIAGNGNTVIVGSLDISGTGLKTLTKTGSGRLTILGTGTDLNGTINANGGAIVVTDFRSLSNDAGTINIGSGGTAGALIIGTSVTPTIAGLTTNKVINLAGSTGGASVYANQSGANPVVLNGDITTTGGSATQSKTLTLGGTNEADNIVNGSIENQAGATTGAVSLLKTGSGTWVLNAANTFTGATTIQNGALKLRATASASDVIGESATNTIVFSGNTTTGTAGGTLEFQGFSGAATTETLGALTPTAGAAKVTLLGNGSSAANLTFTSLGATAAASSVNFDTTAANGGVITLTGQSATTATNLPGTANFQGHLYINGADFATINGSAEVVAPTYAGAGNFQNAAGALVATVHNKLTGSFSNGAATVSSIATNSQTLTMSGNLTVSTGGILQSGGTSFILSDSATPRLILGGAAATNIAIRVDESTDVLNIGSATNPVNIGPTQTGGLTKNGEGKLVFFGTNGQTGTVNINEGTIELNGTNARLAASAGVATVVRQNAFLDFNTSVAFVANPTVAALDGAGTIRNIGSGDVTFVQTGSGTWAGNFSQIGGGVLNVSKLGTTGAPIWRGISDYTGVTTIGGTTGSVTVDYLADIGQDSGIGRGVATDDATNAASLVFAATGATPGGLIYRGDNIEGALTLGSRSATTNRLFTVTGSGLTLASTQTTNLNNAIVWSNPGAIVHGGTAQNRNFIFTGTSQGDNTFVPQITDAVGFATTVTKTGTGIWHLRAADNTYSGPTIITQGILGATDGDGLSPNSNLQFNGGTLYSQGTLTRNIGTGAGEMQFLAPAANTAQFSGGFLGGDSKLTVDWTGTPVWGGGSGFLDTRNGLLLNGSQAQAQGATGSIALSEVEIAGDFSLGTASAAGGSGLTFTVAQNSATVSGLASTAGLVVGQSFTGTNVPSGAYIVSINSATAITLSANTSNTTGTAGTFADGAFIANNLRTIRVDDNANTGADSATISGVISAGDAVTGLRKVGTGGLRLTGSNTYQGETNLNQGTLVVTSLGSGSGGPTSSVGASGVAMGNSNAVTLGNGGTGAGILQYVGVGETSDRKIRLNTTTGSNQIHADGSGALILTNVSNDMVAGAKTLFLRGSNTAGNMITSQLSDNGGALGISVDGGATWILTNPSNNYTGTTTAGAGALGIGHDSALGTGTLINSNSNIFAYGGDRTIANTLQFNSATSHGFIGDYSLTFTNAVAFNASTSSSNFTNNSIVEGKALTFAGGVNANSLTASRNWQFDGSGETIINGDFTTSTAFGVNIIKTGNGTLVLGTNGATSNWNQAGNAVDVDRGTLRFSADEAIPSGSSTNGGLTISPEVATSDTATVDLNGTTQTVNALTANSNGTLVIDNTSSNAATFRFGANGSAVDFGSGIGTYTIQNTGAGALSLVKLGNATATFGSGVTLGHKGITASEGGGGLNITGPVTATSGLRAIGTSVLSLSGGLSDPSLITSIEVGGGSTLSLLDGVGSDIANLTTLNLGGSGTGTVTLNLNVGDSNTDMLTLTSGGSLTLGNTVTFNLTDAGLSPNTTYTILNLLDGGITAFGTGNMIQGAMPGGFTSMNWTVTNNVVQLTTGTLVVGDLYWRGATDNTWNGANNNWSQDKAGTTPATTIPGQGTNVIFAWDGASGPVSTTLEQNFKVNSLTFESGTSTPTSVTIDPGALATSRLEVAPSSSSAGLTISAGGPSNVTISTPFKTGADQTWSVADSGSTLNLSGALQGEADVTKSGSGRVILSAAADPTFNPGQSADYTVDGGTLEIQNVGSLGTVANNNLASVSLSGGAFFYNNATAGTIANPLVLAGGTLSGGGANHTYSGTVGIVSDSFINLADLNGPGANAARNITLSGVVSGSGALTVSSNTTTLTGGNPESGTLLINNASSTWTGDLTLTSGTVDIPATASPTVLPGDITFDGFGRLIVRGLNSQTINRADTLNFTAGTIGEYLLDNTSTVLASDFVVNQNGQVNIGSGGTGASARFTVNDAATSLNIAGNVLLGGNSSISVDGGDADSFTTISGVISDGGNGYSLIINDDAGGWAVTNDIIRLTGLNSFTGNITVDEGTLEFTTVTDISGGNSSLGNGTAIFGGVGAANLRFVGSTSQSTDRPISTGAGALTLSANGTGGASVTYNGAITVTSTANGSLLLLSGAAGSEGVIAGGISQTGNATDMTVNGGTWTHQTGTSRIGDDMTVTGTGTILNLNSGLFQVRDDITVTANAVLNLNGTGVLSFNTATLSADATLNITNGGVVNLGANDAIAAADFDRLFIGQNAGGALPGTLNMGAFNLTTSRLILGERLADRSGVINGTGVLTVTGGDIDLFDGTISANLVTTGTGTFEKFGPGTVTLKGDNSGLASTGDTIINEGTLVFDYSISNTTKVKANEPLSMVGANLILNGNSSAATVQNVNSFTLGSGGNSVISLNRGGSQDIVLNLNAITRAVNALDGTVRFNLPSGTQTATNGITTDTLNTIGSGTNAILGGWATVNDGTGTFFARNVTNAANGNIVAAVTTIQDDVASWLTGENISDSTGFTGTLGRDFTINSLRFNAASGSDLVLGSAGHLRLISGGILVTDNVGGTPSISGGTIDATTFTLPAAVTDLIVTQDSSATFVISSSLQRGQNLVKAGSGTLLLSGTNTYTGATDISNGVLQISGGNAIGDTSLVSLATNRNTTLELLDDEVIGRLSGGRRNDNSDYGTVDIGSHSLTINQTGGNSTYSGKFSGSGTVTKTGNSTLTLSGNDSTGLFTGDFKVNQGLVILNGLGTPFQGVNNITLTGSTSSMRLDNDQTTAVGSRIRDVATITLNSTAGTTADALGLYMRRTAGTTTGTETVGQLILNSGHNTIAAEGNATDRIGRLNFSNATPLVRNNFSTLFVVARNFSAAAGQRGRISFSVDPGGAIGGGGAAASSTISIYPFMVGEDTSAGPSGAVNFGNTFVRYESGTTDLRPLNLTSEYVVDEAAFNALGTGVLTNNIRFTTTPGAALDSDTTGINSLILDSGAGIALTGPAQGLEITSGAILSAGAGSNSLGGFTTLTTATGNPYYIYVTNPAGTLTLATTTLSSPEALVKSGAGTLVLGGVNSVTSAYLNQGTLEISDLDNIGGNSGILAFAGGGLRLGAGFTDDISARTISFLPGGATLDMNGNSLVLASAIGGGGEGGFTKIGTGDLTLNAAASYSGATAFTDGTLTLGLNNALPSGTALTLGSGITNAILDTNGFNQTLGALTVSTNSATLTTQVVVDAANTLTVNGPVLIGVDAAAATTLFTATGGGSFVQNQDGGTFQVGGGTGTTNTNAVTADFSGLANFTADLGMTGVFRVGDSNTNGSGGPNTDPVLTLAGTSNTITSGILGIGDAQGQGGTATLELGGGTNVINADTVYIGATSPAARGSGALVFDGATGTLTLRGSAGGTSRANVAMTTLSSATGFNQTNSFLTAGHSVDLRIDQFVLSERNAGTGSVTSTFTFDDGTADITTLTMGRRTGTAGTGGVVANATLGGGTVTIGTLEMAENTSTTSTGGATADLNITGGTVNIGTGSGTAINMGNAGTGRTTTSTIDLTGGTVNVTGNIVRTGGAGTENATITLDGAILDLNNNNIGSGTAAVTLVAQSGTLRNLNELNGGGNLVKTGAGTLILEGDNNHTGRTVVNAGILSISSEDNLGDAPVAFNAAQLEIDGGTLQTTATFTINDANRGITIGAAGGGIEIATSTELTVENAIVLGGDLTKSGQGALYFNGTTSGAGNVIVAAGTFGGNGTITGNTTIQTGATLTGGTVGGVDSLDFNGDLTLAAGSTWLVDLVETTSGISDSINVGGLLTLGNSELDLALSGTFSGGSYVIANFGTLSGTFNNLAEGDFIGDYQISYGVTTANAITLTAVPEPGTLGLLGLALGGFFFRRARRRRTVAALQEDGDA